MVADKFTTLTIVLDEQKNNNNNWATLHQCLLMLFDSPLNHAGFLEVLIRLADGRVIKMHREVRIPRTFKRFEQLFCNFLQGCDMPVVQTKDGHTKLLQFVGKSVEKLLRDGGGSNTKCCSMYRISNLAPKYRSGADHFTSSIDSMERVVVFIEFGPVNFNILGEGRETEFEIKTINKYQEDENTYSISRYPLAPSLTCVKLTTSFEKVLGVF